MIALVLALEAFPAYVYLSAQYRGVPLDGRASSVVVGALACVVVLNIAAVWAPMKWGEKRLAAYEG